MLYNMKDILAVAKEHKFAIPAFNISSWPMFIGSWISAKRRILR